MRFDGTTGARFAAWWVDTLTHTAATGAAADRRAEIASDVHEQLAAAYERDALDAGSRSVVARVVRGMPSDVGWRLEQELRPGRFAWHLRNPSTAITALLVVMLPLNWAADQVHTVELSGDRGSPLLDYATPLWAAADLLGLSILLLVVLAVAVRVRPRWALDAERFRPRSRLEQARRLATAGLGVTLAGSAVLRFTAVEPVAGAFWAGFVLCLLLYAALLLLTLILKTLTLGRYLPKVGA